MDYNNVKLGLIGRLRVWNERRIAESIRDQIYKHEGERVEVDYSAANRLEKELLEQKRIKKATRDAKQMYKTTYGKNNDGVGESDFVDERLEEWGLKEPKKSPKKENFMDKYSTQKTPEEIAREKEEEENAVKSMEDGKKTPPKLEEIDFYG